MDLQGFAEMTHQVGGHATSKTSLKSHNGRILKPFQSNNRGERERDFYERVFVAEKDSQEFKPLQDLLPKYFGCVEVSGAAESANGMHPGQYLVLEDLTWERQWPCIMDVKMGTQSYENDAPPEKMAYEKTKFPLQEEVGFRIQGFKVFDAEKNAYVEFDKHFGRSVASANELPSAFRNYLPRDDTPKTIAVLTAFVTRLQQFEAWFDVQQGSRFIASSFLFLYSGDGAASPDIRLIDFAHVSTPSPPSRDDGVCRGISTLLRCFRQLLLDAQQ